MRFKLENHWTRISPLLGQVLALSSHHRLPTSLIALIAHYYNQKDLPIRLGAFGNRSHIFIIVYPSPKTVPGMHVALRKCMLNEQI